jgi:DNA polymerase I-like protein with 3'-5' exonuclease and polymerase domains
MITLDFETEAIVGNPLVNPPMPVGLAVDWGNAFKDYYTGWVDIEKYWRKALEVFPEEPLLFHHSSFDLSVGCHWFGTPWPHWSRVHDTLFLAFIADPYSPTLSLKPLSERYLGMPPEEQSELHAWIYANVPEATPKTAGAFISRAPVALVAPYAIGDVVRTRRLFDHLCPLVPPEPYDRERRLAPKLAESSRRGIRVDRERLEKDTALCSAGMDSADQQIFGILGTEPFNVASGDELAAALDKAGKVSSWTLTPKGKRSVAKDNLLAGIADKQLLNLIAYRSTMKTCVGTFMRPWLDLSAADGRVHTEWNQVANDESAKGHGGTRTGRLSSARPNFQNPPNPFGLVIPEGLAALPNMRSYLLPELGHVWIKRDFSSQEVRILAHFEDGTLMELYRDDPFFDPHEHARILIHGITGIWYVRKDVKIVGFSIIYGSGVRGLASQLGRPLDEAHTLREAYFKAMPSAPALARATSARGRSGGCVTTWGGRTYFVEAPRVIGGRVQSFEYKLLNYLIQGSAADQTKQVLCDWWEDPGREAVFMATIHDEINASAPEELWQEEMHRLRRCMDQDYFDVPMRSEGEWGPNTAQVRTL